jgi:predicted nucleic acid-binding protein
MVRVYFDACCLNRPFDDQTQPRIHLEAEAVLAIIARCETGDWEWISSEVIDLEIDRMPDAERRRRIRTLISHSHKTIALGQTEVERAQEFETWGIPAYDALHLACAESAGADVMLTTDDKLVHKAITHAKRLRVRVENPLVWVEEVIA